MLQVTCAIIFEKNTVLCARRGMTMVHPNKWEFPGGKVEQDETEEACLIRELKEELGIDVRIIKKWNSFEHHYHNGPSLNLIPMQCEIISGTPGPREHEEIKWVGPDDLHKLDWAEADLPVVNEVMRRFARNFIKK